MASLLLVIVIIENKVDSNNHRQASLYQWTFREICCECYDWLVDIKSQRTWLTSLPRTQF